MNISKRQNGELNAIITIEVKPEDYQPRVDKTIKNYTKTANIPGFRPGHVPAGIIKKKLGKEVPKAILSLSVIIPSLSTSRYWLKLSFPMPIKSSR